MRRDAVCLAYFTAQYDMPVVIAIPNPVVLKDEHADSSGDEGCEEVESPVFLLRIVHEKTSVIKNGQTQRSARRIGSDFILLDSHVSATDRALQARSAQADIRAYWDNSRDQNTKNRPILMPLLMPQQPPGSGNIPHHNER